MQRPQRSEDERSCGATSIVDIPHAPHDTPESALLD
jgi:hypothetical protein